MLNTTGKSLHVATDPVALFVCRSCRVHNAPKDGTQPGAVLVHLVERSLSDLRAQNQVVVLAVHCLSRCDHPCSAAVLPPDGPTIVLDRLTPSTEVAEALVALALNVHEKGRIAATTLDGPLFRLSDEAKR